GSRGSRRRGRSGDAADHGAGRRSQAAGPGAAALADGASAAGARVRAAGGASAPYRATPGALRADPARLPGLPGRDEPNDPGHRLDRVRASAAGIGPVVAGIAADRGWRLVLRPGRQARLPVEAAMMMPVRSWVFPRIHDLYVARAVLVTVLLTWAVLLGLDVVLAVFGEMG